MPKKMKRDDYSCVGTLAPVGIVLQSIGVSAAAVVAWRKEGFPQSKKIGGVDLLDTLDVIKWMRDKWVSDRDDMNPNVDSPNLERYRKIKGDILEMERDEKQGKLLNAEEVKKNWKQILSGVWNQIQRFRDTLPPLLINKTGMQIREIIIEETNRAGAEIVKEIKNNEGN